jgi:hypothetical protein
MKNEKGTIKKQKKKEIEKFIIDQMERYIKIHKKHEKDLKYIG